MSQLFTFATEKSGETKVEQVLAPGLYAAVHTWHRISLTNPGPFLGDHLPPVLLEGLVNAWCYTGLDRDDEFFLANVVRTRLRKAPGALLFTFITAKAGSTIVDQVKAPAVGEAVALWHETSEAFPGKLGTQNSTNLRVSDHLPGVWSYRGWDESGTEFLVDIILSNFARSRLGMWTPR
jgi:hypothetical protein